MATIYTYPSNYNNAAYIFRASSGGTVFSSNVAGAVFDYFTDTLAVNDAIYFSGAVANNAVFANLNINVGTAIAGTGITGVWETRSASTWEIMHDITDPSNGFTVTGPHLIKFPIQAGSSPNTTINGIAAYNWIRYRITGVTTVTEGGANQTTRPTVGDGILTVSGSTDAAPASFLEMYNWIIVNAPEIGATHPATSIFKFDNLRLYFASRIKTLNEQIFIGNGANCSHNFSYLESGTKVGTDGWRDASSFFFCIGMGTNFLATSSNFKVYGGFWDGFRNYVNGVQRNYSSYIGVSNGEWLGVSIGKSSGYFSTGDLVNKVTVPGGIITASFPAVYPNNLRIADPGTSIWGLYSSGGTISNASFAMPTVAVLNWNQYGGESLVINLINCTTLPEQNGAAPRVVSRRAEAPIANLLSLFYEDVSAGTFTDYTAASQSATVDDVPLDGDAGDCYYFRYATGSQYQTPFTFTITNQSNDYVYIWEYYRGSGWFSTLKTWDATNNFTTSGRIYNATSSWTTATVNSVNGYWLRLRIVTKGTATPKCSKIGASIQNAVGDWRIYEKMSCVFTIVDNAGDVIDGATVSLTNESGTTNLTTGVDGKTTSTDFIISVTQFDPTESDPNYNIKKTNTNPYTITVSKTGYETYSKKMSILSKVDEIIKLKTALSIRDGLEGEKYLALSPEEGSSSEIIEV